MKIVSLCLALITASAHAGLPPLPTQPDGVPWPTNQWPTAALPENADHAALVSVFQDLFTAQAKSGLPDNRALLVVHRGQIVVENYAPGFSPQSRFMSWSLAKSVTNALTGILVRDDRLSLDDKLPIAAWQATEPQKQHITPRHLLHMTAGFGADRNAGFLLFHPDDRYDIVDAAIRLEQPHAPGELWGYSTGTSNLLAGVVSQIVGPGRKAVGDWATANLFAPLGATSFQLEFDTKGNYIGGAFTWATARDWARLAYLYLRNGRWESLQLLPEGWVDFTRTPAPAPNNTQFGAHFWITAPPAEGQTNGIDPELRGFYMSGSRGQLVLIVPERDLLVMRFGESHVTDWQDFEDLINTVAHAFPKLDTTIDE